jgi:hypothetical protein
LLSLWKVGEIEKTFSHPSTNQACPCLASEVRQEQAHSGWYGCKEDFLNRILMIFLHRIHGKKAFQAQAIMLTTPTKYD